MSQPAPETARRSTPLVYYGALAGAGAALFILGLWPSLGHPIGDKAAHILAFGLVAIALRRSRTALSPWRAGFVLLLIAAVALEFAQAALSPTRVASWSDGTASVIGAVIGYLIGSMKQRRYIFIGLIWLVSFALSTNWAINHGRYKVFNQLGIDYCKDDQQRPIACRPGPP